KLPGLLVAMGMVDPEAEATTEEQLKKAEMFASPENSLPRPRWLEGMGIPTIAEAKEGQENFWLIQDILRAIKKVNDDFFQSKDGEGKPRTAEHAPIKQLVEITVGEADSILEGEGRLGRGKRYRWASPKAKTLLGGFGASPAKLPKSWKRKPVLRVKSLTGRGSEHDLYNVLPFRLVVIADNELAGRLIGEISGTESFITIESVRIKAIDNEQASSLLKTSPEDVDLTKLYGLRGLVQLTIIGESLVFELPGGRITTAVKKARKAGDEAAPVKANRNLRTQAKPTTRPAS
ncbi:MAG: hypothetical protein QF662_06070, partial [Phycisphaerae bacterium]|nr:hypothetical protein [Phycisphaerae bacterium]